MAKRLTKIERREQLLLMAESIVREEGADALTLITLAEKVGVSKPVTYDQFAKRENLLVALYERYDERFIAVVREAVESEADTLKAAAQIVSQGYVDCVMRCGPVYDAVVAALSAYPEFSDLRHKIRESFIEAYVGIFGPLSRLSGAQMHQYLIAFYGASEEMGRAILAGVIEKEAAVDVLAELIVSLLGR